jgi:hypothetical protein
VIPHTIVGFFFFLLLVAPGVGYELLRERRTPKLDETAFREVARVALYSFGFSLLAISSIAALRIWEPGFFFDPVAYNHDTKSYLKTHYTSVLWTIILEVLIAFIFVALADRIAYERLYRRLYPRLPKGMQKVLPEAKIRRYGIWYDLLQAEKPKGKIAWLSIRLSDGSRIGGFFYQCTAYDKFDGAEIALTRGTTCAGSMKLRDVYQQDEINMNAQDFIWVRGEDISFMKVEYRPIS